MEAKFKIGQQVGFKRSGIDLVYGMIEAIESYSNPVTFIVSHKFMMGEVGGDAEIGLLDKDHLCKEYHRVYKDDIIECEEEDDRYSEREIDGGGFTETIIGGYKVAYFFDDRSYIDADNRTFIFNNIARGNKYGDFSQDGSKGRWAVQ